MAINKNHEFEELNGIKCGIVERNAPAERAQFLKELLEFNRYTVVIIPTPQKPQPTTPPPAPGAEPSTPIPPAPPAPETFTIGVTDTTFNPVNAIFGRLLKAKNGNFVTLAYWEQQEAESDDDVPYFEKQ